MVPKNAAPNRQDFSSPHQRLLHRLQHLNHQRGLQPRLIRLPDMSRNKGAQNSCESACGSDVRDRHREADTREHSADGEFGALAVLIAALLEVIGEG
jgi:hypothetical protein